MESVLGYRCQGELFKRLRVGVYEIQKGFRVLTLADWKSVWYSLTLQRLPGNSGFSCWNDPIIVLACDHAGGGPLGQL